MSLKNITIEGQNLDEFLNQNEPVKDEIKRNKFFREQIEDIKLGRHVKARYKQHQEKNGEVNILGQQEINRANFRKYLVESLKNEKILNSLVIVLIAHPNKRIFTTKEIAKIIEVHSKANDIPILRSVNHSLRGRLGIIRKSELSDFMVFYERNTLENKGNTMRYGIRDDALEMLTIEDAVELARTRKKAFEDKSVVLNPDRSRRKDAKSAPKEEKKIVKTEPKKSIETEPEKTPEKATVKEPEKLSVKKIEKIPIKATEKTPEKLNDNLISNIIDQIKSIKSDNDNAVLIIKGDIHIHINITR